jgi:2-polyprenyl-3-methyl-5-hydroxy-6-metoxy-1,4-benzoquinol methylase
MTRLGAKTRFLRRLKYPIPDPQRDIVSCGGMTARDLEGMLEALDTDFPRVFAEVCCRGYQVLGRTRSHHPSTSGNPWQVKQALPPSYEAYGRYRFLQTLRLARKLSPARILEVAAGSGFNAACLYEEGREVVVNDLRPLEVEAWTTGENLRLVEGDLHALDPERLGRFDLVLACEVIEHAAHGDRMLRHLRSLLRDGGTLLLTTPNGSYFRSKLPTHSEVKDFAALEARQFQPDSDGHLFLYTREELARLCTQSGFTDVHIDAIVTPFISGHACLRYLPKHPVLLQWYLLMDRAVRGLGEPIRERFCTSLLLTARGSAAPTKQET